MCSPSAALKVNCLVIRYLHFRSVEGDLQEGQVYGKRLCDYASRCQLPLFPSTKSRFLCFFGLRNPRFQAFRAQNRHFCALLGSGTLVFGHFEHKIEVFVRFYPPSPPFRAFRAQNLHFCARSGSRSDVADDTGAMLPLGRCRCRGAEPLGR